MRRITIAIGVCTTLLLLAGVALYSGKSAQASPDARILYYHDPMHPEYRSDKPGIAPDCGMKLEPVYANTTRESGRARSSGTIQISDEQKRMIGVRTEQVQESTVSAPVRFLARVVPDETKTFIINAPTDSLVEDAGTATTGSLVHKGDKLGSYFTSELYTPQQTYILSTAAGEREKEGAVASAAHAEATDPSQRPNIRQLSNNQRMVPMSGIQSASSVRYAEILRNLGMDPRQIEEIGRTRQPAREIYIYAPADAIVLSRSITAGQRFERGREWFRLADLSRVWVVADVFENDARLIAGAKDATLRYQGTTMPLRMSDVAPSFDPETRTLKLRFETANPGFKLRPGMFADVEIQVSHAPAVSVPVDAISDNGARKLVFVENSAGALEPRTVETGARMGDRILIARGLQAGERVVVQGNFLIDSESRIHPASSPAPRSVAGMPRD